jgi:hypothetical protein
MVPKIKFAKHGLPKLAGGGAHKEVLLDRQQGFILVS